LEQIGTCAKDRGAVPIHKTTKKCFVLSGQGRMQRREGSEKGGGKILDQEKTKRGGVGEGYFDMKRRSIRAIQPGIVTESHLGFGEKGSSRKS